MTSFRIALVIAAAVVAVPAAQWLNHPTTGIPRKADGKPKMGFRDGFTVKNDHGQPTLSYIQVSRDTVIELQPANVNRQGQAIAGWKQP